MGRETAGLIAAKYNALRGITYDTKASVILITILAAVIGVSAYLISANAIQAIVAFASSIFFTVIFNRVVKKIILHKHSILTTRRLDAVAAVEMTIIALGVAVSVIVTLAGAGIGLGFLIFVASIAAASFVGYAARRAMLVHSTPASCILSSFSPFLISIPLGFTYTQSITRALLAGSEAFAIGTALMEIARAAIDRFWLIKGVRPFKLFQAFVQSLLEGNNRDFEHELLKLSREEEIDTKLFIIRPKGAGRPVALVITDAHPGPFRDVGSSVFPSLVYRAFESRGIDALVLKGLSSHEKNLTTRRDTERLAELLASTASKNLNKGGFSEFFAEPRRISKNGASLLSLGMAGKNLTILTLHPNPMEDLPTDVLPSNWDGKLVAIDAHNSYADGYSVLEDSSLTKLRELLHDAVVKRGEGRYGLGRVGYSRIVPSRFGLVDGMGPGGIACMVVEVNGKKSAVVVVDANNAVPWVREQVREVASELGVDDAELCTTDTHAVNAVKLGGRGYHPLGEVLSPESLRPYFRKVISEALKNMREAEALFLDMRVNGFKVFSGLLEEVARSLKHGSRLLLMFLLVAPPLSALLAALI